MSLLQAATLFVIMVSLAALPSASVALVVARSATAGVANGIAVSFGIVLGDLLFVVLALLGLTAVAELTGGFFAIIKMIGGLYLVWLGVSLLRSRGGLQVVKPVKQGKSLLLSLSAGFFLTLGDIKAMVFYASLFPLFIDVGSVTPPDYVLIAAITIVSVGSVKMLYALLASRVVGSVQQKKFGRAPQKVAGCLLLGVGSYVAFRA